MTDLVGIICISLSLQSVIYVTESPAVSMDKLCL